METLFGIAILLGLGSSLHCLGMCGPIAFILPLNRTSTASKLTGTLAYSLGRVLTYAMLGAAFGLIGKSFQIMGVLQVMSVVFGVLIILVVIFPRMITKIAPVNRGYLKFNNYIQNKLGYFLKNKSASALFSIGLLNGLLPCGMVYMALMGSLAYGSVLEGMLFMTFFGLGTIPAMGTATYFSTAISASLRQKFQKAVPYVMVIFGALIIIRGLNLNIPYLSPEVKVNEKKEVTMSCCSAKEKTCDVEE
jgi:sulfite exporter TauE/SafE